MKRKVYGLMMAAGIIIVVGTAGSIDIEFISTTQGVLQTVGALIVGVIGYVGLTKEEKK